MRLWGALVVVGLVGCEGALLGIGPSAPAVRGPTEAATVAPPSPDAPDAPAPGPSVPDAPVAPFTCQPGLTAAEPLQRLTREQYRLALSNLFDGPTLALVDAELAALPPDILGQALEASDRARSFAEPQVLLFNAMARTLGDAAGAAPYHLDACLGAPNPDAACLERGLGSFATKAWRRPLGATERSELVSLYRLGATRALGVSAAVRYVLQSPDFLYRLEALPRAERLALLLWDAPADQALTAAEARLGDASTRRVDVDRALTHPLARQKLGRFFTFWLKLEGAGAPPAGPAAFLDGVDTSGLRAAAITEALTFLDDVTFETRGGYAELMTSRRSFAAHPGLARLHGHAPVGDGGVATMGGARRGVLMRLPFLLHGDGETHPITRGAAVRRRLMCQPIALPAPDNFSSGPDVNTLQMRQTLSTRQRTDLKTGTGSCAGCHQSINPLGFAFEGLDALGRERTTEVQYLADGGVLASHRVDDRVELIGPAGAPVTRDGAAGLSQHLAESVEGPACFVQFLFEYYRQRPAGPADGCTLAAMDAAVRAPGGTLLSALEALAADTVSTP